MDGSRLDTLAKALAGTGSRRAALRLLAGGLLGGLLAGGALESRSVTRTERATTEVSTCTPADS
jgi:hypothetical protein